MVEEEREWGFCACECRGAVWVCGGEFKGNGGVGKWGEVVGVKLDWYRGFVVAADFRKRRIIDEPAAYGWQRLYECAFGQQIWLTRSESMVLESLERGVWKCCKVCEMHPASLSVAALSW